jgi:hypothetical protein
MSTSKRIEEWIGATKKDFRFQVEFFEDNEQGLFRASIRASKPISPDSQRPPRQAPTRVSEEKPIHLKPQADLDVLKGTVEVTIRESYGQILHLRKISLDE